MRATILPYAIILILALRDVVSTNIGPLAGVPMSHVDLRKNDVEFKK